MLKKMRRKFILIVMAIVLALVAAFCTAILTVIHSSNISDAQSQVQKFAADYQKEGGFPFPSGRPIDNVRCFGARFDGSGTLFEIKYSPEYYTVDQLTELAEDIYSTGKADGQLHDILYVRINSDYMSVVAGMDITLEMDMFYSLLVVVLSVAAAVIVAFFVLVWLLSHWIVRPVKIALDKQKQFIADASHGIKTPITVISASCDLLGGENAGGKTEEWVGNIKSQADIISALATDMLALSRMEELPPQKENFDLSHTVSTTCMAFESVAFEAGKSLTSDIAGGITYTGDRKALTAMLSALIENAIVHSGENAQIFVSLTKNGKARTITVKNTNSHISTDDLDKIFQRFYRTPQSRAQTQGSGLGLSIVESLSEKNNWRVTAHSTQNEVTFTVAL